MYARNAGIKKGSNTSDKMRVLYFVHTFKEKNGIAIHLQNIIKNLPDDVEVKVIHGKGPSLPFFSSLRIPLMEVFEALVYDFDIMHVHGYGNLFSFLGALISAIKRKPLVWTVHGYPRIKGAKRIFYILYKHFMAPVIFWRASAIISVSKEAIKELRNETDKEITYIPNGIDLSIFKPCKDYKKEKYICYVGRLDEDKGIERLIKEVDLPILIVGKDEGIKSNLIKIAEERGKKLLFKEVEFEEMPEMYCKCRYVVLPSKYEGFPLTMLESIACLRPFLTTNVGDVKIVLQDLFESKSGKFIIKGNIQELIDKLEKENLNVLLKNARKRLMKYSWGVIVKNIVKIYEEVERK